jgi:DNA-binding transcriptional ArsR family regulator
VGRKYKQIKSPSFVMLEKKDLLKSKAYKSLKGSAVKVYIFFRGKAVGPLRDSTKYVPLDKEIKAPYSIIIEDTGLSRGTVRKALLELENKGFIDLVKQGGLKSGGYTSSIYKLSTRFIGYGKDTFESGKMKKEKDVDYKGFGKVHKQRSSIKSRPALIQ